MSVPTKYMLLVGSGFQTLHGFNLKYGNIEDCILFKRGLFNTTSHHAINVDTTL